MKTEDMVDSLQKMIANLNNASRRHYAWDSAPPGAVADMYIVAVTEAQIVIAEALIELLKRIPSK